MKTRILMVDDDKEFLKMLRSYFELKQYEVVIVEDGAEALKKIEIQPNLILLEINMP